MLAADLSPAAQSTSTTDASPAANLKSAAGRRNLSNSDVGGRSSAPTEDPRVLLEDTIAQLEVARQQRTEVSSELYKYRLLVDDLKEQRVTLQAELGRRLQLHKEDVDRIKSLQRELDHLRSSYSEKQSEIIELSTQIQDLLTRVDSTEQQRELKAENELLWRKIDELKRNEMTDATQEESGNTRAERWRTRFVELEQTISDAFEERRAAITTGAEQECDDSNAAKMLQAIMQAEETMRRNLATQLNTLKSELRSRNDQIEDLTRQISQSEVANVKLDMEMQRTHELAQKLSELESERENNLSRISQLKSELEKVKVRSKKGLEGAEQQKHAMELREAEKVKELHSVIAEKDALVFELEKRIQDSERLLNKVQNQLEETRVSREREKVNSDETEALKDRLEVLENEIAVARMSADAKLVELTRKAEHLSEHKGRLERKSEALQRKYDETLEELNRTAQELELAKEEVEQQSEEISELRGHLAAAQQNYDGNVVSGEMAAKVALLEAQHHDAVNALREATSNHQCQINRLKADLANAQEALDNSQLEVDNSKNLLSDMQQQLEDEQHLKAKLKAQLTETNDKLNELEEELREANLKVDEARLKADEARREAEEAQNQLVATKQEIQNLQEQLNRTSAQQQEEVARLEDEITKLRSQYEDALVRVTKKEEEVLAKQKQLQEEEAKVKELQVALDEALNGPSTESMISDNFKTLSSEQQVIKLKAALNRALLSEREQSSLAEISRTRIKEHQVQIENLKREKQKAEEEWRSEYDGYLTHLHQLNTVQSKLTQEKAQLETELQKTKAAITTLKAKQQVGPPTEIAESERERWNKDKRNLEKSLEEAKRKLSKLQKDLSEKVNKGALSLNPSPKSSMSKKKVNAWSVKYIGLGGFLLCWLSYVLGALAN